METHLYNLEIEDLPYMERDLNFAQKVSLCFLLFGDQHAQAAYILQKLLALARSPAEDQLHSDLMRQYAKSRPNGWQENLVEALCIINARKALRKLGFNWEALQLQYLPHVKEISLNVHPLLKALYMICEQLNLAQSERLILDINKKLEFKAEEPLSFHDFYYLEIFLLDWLTRRHLRVGDNDTVGSDVQLLIEYFKLNDLHSLSTLLVLTVNSNHKVVDDASQTSSTLAPFAVPLPSIIKSETLAANNDYFIPPENAIRLTRENAGILLIINQQSFHRNASENLSHLLPKIPLKKRDGTDVDKRRLTYVFSALGYTVKAHDNVKHLEILELIRNACALSMMRDSLIVCILSHGFKGAVYGSDSIPLSIIDIQNVLCHDKNLEDKPKLLIIQACQHNQENNQTRNVNATTKSPIQHLNMVVAMSTVPGYPALRHNIQGSWFIQTLCKAVIDHAARKHVLDILTIAIGRVSEKRGDEDQKMLPSINSTLGKNIYFPIPEGTI